MMKKKYTLFVIVLIIIVVIAGCAVNSSKEKDPEDPKKVEEQMAQAEKKEKEKMERVFENLIKEKSEPYKLVEFIDDNISKASSDYAEKMLLELESMQKSYEVHYMDELFKDNRQSKLIEVFPHYEFDKNKIDNIEDEKLRELITRIIDGKYKIVSTEGYFYIVTDYKGFDNYKKYVSDEISSFIEIKAIHLDTPPMIDGAVIIPWDEISNRLINLEEYLKKYPDGAKSEEITRLYGEYLVMYMSGGDNTPIYNIENKIIFDDILESYKKTIANNKESITGNTISKYLELIEENEYIIDETITSKIIDFNNEAIGDLEEHK